MPHSYGQQLEAASSQSLTPAAESFSIQNGLNPRNKLGSKT